MQRLLHGVSILVVLLTLFVATSRAFAVGGQWTSVGPWGGDVECMATSGSSLFAGAQNGGVFISTDGGATWSAANTGLGNPTVYALATDPVAPTVVYAGTAGEGIFRSSDGGTSWSKLATSPLSVYSLTVDPGDHNTLYAGTGGSGVYKTTDGGATWAPTNTGMATAYVYAVAVDPRLTTTIYAATDTGIFRSLDGGTNWSQIASIGYTRDLAISATTPAILYAATINGVVKSSDGTAWVQAGLSGSSAYAVAISPIDSAKVFVGTAAGIFTSVNSGTNWTGVSEGLSNTNVQAIILDSSYLTNDTLFAGTHEGGVFKSSNDGGNWQSTNQGLGNTFIQAVTTNYGSPVTIYAATNDGIYKSTNSGLSWSASSSGLENQDVVALMHDQSVYAEIFAGTWGAGVYKSTDQGATWSAYNAGIATAQVHALANNVYYFYAGTSSGLFRRSTSGPGWTLCSNGIPANAEVFSVISAAGGLYVGTDKGLFLSTDYGASFNQIGTGLPPCGVVYDLAADPITYLYAATCGGVYKSSDGGGMWSSANSGLTAANAFNITVTGTSTAPNLYVGTDGGVFVSTDRSATWQPLNSGLTNSDIYAFATSIKLPTRLYAGSWGGGVFELSSGEDVAVSPASLDLGYRVAAQNSGTQTVDISNGGLSNLTVNSIAIAGAGAAAFSVTPDSCTSLTPTIASGGSCSVRVTFAPPAGEVYVASLEIVSTSASSPFVTIPLKGSGAYPLTIYRSGSGDISRSGPYPVDGNANMFCSMYASYCGAYPGGTSITLSPTTCSPTYFTGWSGCPMTMGDSCFISMNRAVDVTANFGTYSLQSFINAASNGEVVKLTSTTYGGAVMDRPEVMLALSGRWNCDFTYQEGSESSSPAIGGYPVPPSFTAISGSLTVAQGCLIIDQIQIR